MISENLDSAADAGSGDIRAGLALLTVFFVIFGGWAAMAPLDAGVSAPGVIVVSGNRQTIQHRDGGTVARLAVKEGDKVTKGQILIDLTTTELKSQERALIGQALELEALRARLAAEAGGKPTIERPAGWADLPADYVAPAATVLARQGEEMAARQSALSAQLSVLAQRQAQLRSRIDGYGQQSVSTDRQTTLIADELEGINTLAAKGLVPLTRVRALERTQAELQGRSGELLAQIQQSNQAIGEARLQAISVQQDRAQELAQQLRETDTVLAELSPRIDAIRSQLENARIRAPAQGTVVGLRIFTEGGVIRPGDAILDIIPEAQPLVIEAQVEPRDADNLSPGMKTQVRFTSFVGQNLPTLHGAVSRVSADRFTDERSGRPYFLTEITVTREELAKLEGEGVSGKVRAGLPVEIVVPLRKRSALQYLVEPLDRSIWRAFKEE